MSEIDRGIAELEATLKLMKKLRGHGNKGKRRSPEQRAKMSAARKAAWAEKYEAELAPKRKRETRKGLGEIPRDPFEAALFGGAR